MVSIAGVMRANLDETVDRPASGRQNVDLRCRKPPALRSAAYFLTKLLGSDAEMLIIDPKHLGCAAALTIPSQAAGKQYTSPRALLRLKTRLRATPHNTQLLYPLAMRVRGFQRCPSQTIDMSTFQTRKKRATSYLHSS